MLLTLRSGIAFSFEYPCKPMLIEQLIGIRRAAFWTGIISAAAAVGSVVSGLVIGCFSDRIRPLRRLLPILILTAVMLFIQRRHPGPAADSGDGPGRETGDEPAVLYCPFTVRETDLKRFSKIMQDIIYQESGIRISDPVRTTAGTSMKINGA